LCCLQIFEALGTPNENVWAGVERLTHYRSNYPQWQPKDWAVLVPRLAGDALGINLLSSMLTYDPEARISAAQALKHPWFDDLGGNNAPGDVPSSSRAIPSAGPSGGPLAGPGGARLPHGAAQQGGPAARPPPMPSLLGVCGRAVLGPVQVQQPVGQLEQVQHSLQQQQQQLQARQFLHMQQPPVHLPQPPVHLQQPQAQLQQLHLQQAQHAVQFPQAPLAPAGAATSAAAAAAAGVQAACRSNQPPCMWPSQRPPQHGASGGASGAAPTPA
jgi:hypothetical protein